MKKVISTLAILSASVLITACQSKFSAGGTKTSTIIYPADLANGGVFQKHESKVEAELEVCNGTREFCSNNELKPELEKLRLINESSGPILKYNRSATMSLYNQGSLSGSFSVELEPTASGYKIASPQNVANFMVQSPDWTKFEFVLLADVTGGSSGSSSVKIYRGYELLSSSSIYINVDCGEVGEPQSDCSLVPN